MKCFVVIFWNLFRKYKAKVNITLLIEVFVDNKVNVKKHDWDVENWQNEEQALETTLLYFIYTVLVNIFR